MKNKADKFKTKGASILKGPTNIRNFINDSSEHKENAQIHKNTFPQLHKTSTQHNKLGRLHLQIRQDLIDKLIEIVFRRKRDQKKSNKKATQRAIIEEALENYFKNEENISADKT